MSWYRCCCKWRDLITPNYASLASLSGSWSYSGGLLTIGNGGGSLIVSDPSPTPTHAVLAITSSTIQDGVMINLYPSWPNTAKLSMAYASGLETTKLTGNTGLPMTIGTVPSNAQTLTALAASINNCSGVLFGTRGPGVLSTPGGPSDRWCFSACPGYLQYAGGIAAPGAVPMTAGAAGFKLEVIGNTNPIGFSTLAGYQETHANVVDFNCITPDEFYLGHASFGGSSPQPCLNTTMNVTISGFSGTQTVTIGVTNYTYNLSLLNGTFDLVTWCGCDPYWTRSTFIYRNNTTGVYGAYASSPGAGYTLIDNSTITVQAQWFAQNCTNYMTAAIGINSGQWFATNNASGIGVVNCEHLPSIGSGTYLLSITSGTFSGIVTVTINSVI